MKEAKEKRGRDCLEGREAKVFTGFGSVMTGLSGLQTPTGGAAAGTPTVYASEASAPTPMGLNPGTPGMGGGYKTPDARTAPSTPVPAMMGMIQGGLNTPYGGRPGLNGPSTFAPATPQGAPGTPFNMAGQYRPGGAPATPAGISGRNPATVPPTPTGQNFGPGTPGGRPGAVPSTPFGFQPTSPGPGTPAYAGGVPGTPGYQGRMPQTPGGPPPSR